MVIVIKLWPVFTVLGKAVKLKYIDGRIAEERHYIGEKVLIKPLTKLGKLKDYTKGVRDNYHYILPPNLSQQPTDLIEITEPTTFRVIEQRYSTSGNSLGIFCILRSDSGLTFSEDCLKIKNINER